MRTALCAAMVIAAMAMPAASETPADCPALFETFKAKYPFDLDQCVAGEAVYTLDNCPKPDSFVPGALPITHVILALDASGSMAGKIGGRSKMEIAKGEARAFLNDLHPSTKVSLVVYGHEGDNTEAQRAASCAGSAVVHPFKASRGKMKASISALQPVGWTPLAGVLTFIRSEVEKLPEKSLGKTTAPVVYLISDGEETCDGDPVAEAKALVNLGTRTIVNTIGFDADETTRAQLEAIAKAGQGAFFPAKDAEALRARLREIVDAEGKIHRYNYCVNINRSRISGAWQKVGRSVQKCHRDNDPAKFKHSIRREIKAAAPDSEIAQCAKALNRAANDYTKPYAFWIKDHVFPISTKAVEASDAYLAKMGLIQIEN